MKRPEPIRQAKTSRGDSVISKVLNAAESLLQDRYLADISVSELAKEAGVVRASLLLQFPSGWPDVTAAIGPGTLFRDFDQFVIDELNGQSSTSIAKSAAMALKTFINLAEKSGLLVANLRSQMFVWGTDGDKFFHLPAQDYNEQFAELLAQEDPAVSDQHRYAAEALINFALDIAAGAGLYPWTTEEKFELVQSHVQVTLAGLKSGC